MTKKVDTIKCGQPQFFRFGFGRNNVQAVISHLAEIPLRIDIRKKTIIERFIFSPDFQSKFKIYLTLTRPLRRKLRMRWFFDGSKVKESSFFNRTLLISPQIFDAHLFWVRRFYSLSERMRLKRKKRCLFTLTNL